MVNIICNYAIFFLPDVYFNMPITTVIIIFNLRILEYNFSIIFALLKLMKIYAMISASGGKKIVPPILGSKVKDIYNDKFNIQMYHLNTQ